MFTAIVSFFKSPKNVAFLLGVGVVLIIVLLLQQCSTISNLKQQSALDKDRTEQNIRALTDSVKHEKIKGGEIEASKSSIVATEKDLQKYNDSLYKELKKEKGVVQSLITANASINNTVSLSNLLDNYGNGKYGLQFHKENHSDSLSYVIEGVSKFAISNNSIVPDSTIISKNEIDAKIVLGFTDENNDYRVFARSPSKLLKIDELSGVLIIPKNANTPNIECPPAPKVKKFGLGFFVGAALGNNFKPIPAVGIGFDYTFIRLF